MGFFFHPLRLQFTPFASVGLPSFLQIFGLLSLFFCSFILRCWEHGLHTVRSSRLVEIFLLLGLRTVSFPQHLKLFFFLPPSSWRSRFSFQRYPTGAKVLLSSLCRRCGTSLASFSPMSLKSPPPFSVLLFVASTSRLRFYFSSPFRYRYFHDSFTHSSSSGWHSLPIDLQAMLLRNRLSFL